MAGGNACHFFMYRGKVWRLMPDSVSDCAGAAVCDRRKHVGPTLTERRDNCLKKLQLDNRRGMSRVMAAEVHEDWMEAHRYSNMAAAGRVDEEAHVEGGLKTLEQFKQFCSREREFAPFDLPWI